MVPRAARFCPRPVQFVQGELLSMRGAAIRVRCACVRAFYGRLSQMIPRYFCHTRDPAFASEAVEGRLLLQLTAGEGVWTTQNLTAEAVVLE